MNFLLDIKSVFLPEVIILIFAFLNLFFAIFKNKKAYKLSASVNVLGILIALSSVGFLQAEPTYSAFGDSIICNVYTVFFKSLILISGFFIALFSLNSGKKYPANHFEAFFLFMISLFAALVLSCSNNFLIAFVAMNVFSISYSLLMAVINRRTSKIVVYKYLFGDLCCSLIFALGVSYLYALTTTLDFALVTEFLQGYQGSLLFNYAVMFITLGLVLKLGVFPLISLSKLYEKIFSPFSLLVVFALQIGVYSVLSRFLVISSSFAPFLSLIIFLCAVVGAVYSLLSVFNETKLNRYFALSIVFQNSLFLLILSLANIYNIASLLYCLICYLFITIALFAVVLLIKQRTKREELNGFNGVAYRHPFLATAVIFLFIALAGLPPTCGFWERFFVISSVARLGSDYWFVLFVTLCLFVASLLIFVKPIKMMFDRGTEKTLNGRTSVVAELVFYFCTFVVISLCFYSGKIVELCELIAYILH